MTPTDATPEFCSAIWNGCKCSRPPHDDDRHVWMNTLDNGRAVDPALYPTATLDARELNVERLRQKIEGLRDHAQRQGTWGIEYGDDRFMADVLAALSETSHD